MINFIQNKASENDLEFYAMVTGYDESNYPDCYGNNGTECFHVVLDGGYMYTNYPIYVECIANGYVHVNVVINGKCYEVAQGFGLCELKEEIEYALKNILHHL